MNGSKTFAPGGAGRALPAALALAVGLAVLLLALAAPTQLPAQVPAQDTNGTARYTEEGVGSCITCYGAGDEVPAHDILATPHAVVADPSSPFGEGLHDCETCHGPSRAHLTRNEDGSRPPVDFRFGKAVPAEERNAVCLRCHQDATRFHWPGSVHDTEGVACVDCHDVHPVVDRVHDTEGVACVDCHDVHAVNDRVLALETQPAVCFDCHQEQRAQFQRQSRHPVQASTAMFSNTGLMSCTDCHNPHGTSGPALLTRSTINEACYECHAEKRGPFLWEHAPVREDCTNCHTPHGSNYGNLLTARQPWMCQQCHIAPQHPSGVYSGAGIPPTGADPRMLGKQCLNCHVQVHGSNHPSGIRLTR